MTWLAPLLAYLLGSIPFGLFAGLLAGKDIRLEGSRNIGATNVVRVCGWKWGAPVFLLDAIKGFAPVFWIAPALAPGVCACKGGGGPDALVLVACALAAILGHNFPVWLRFKGGKGVATSAGALAALLPVPLGIALCAFGAVVAAFRYISLGSMTAAVVLVAAQIGSVLRAGRNPFAGDDLVLSAAAILMALLVILRHRANIGRLLAGTENKIGGARPTPAGEEKPAEKTA